MQITDIRIRKIEKEGKMKAVVSVTIDEEFVIHDIKIIEGDKGLFPEDELNEDFYLMIHMLEKDMIFRLI